MVQYLLLWLKIWSFQSGIFVSNLYIYKRQSSFLLELSNKFWVFIYDVTIFSLFVENSLPLVTIFLLLWAINLSSIFDPSTLKVWDVIYGWPFLQVSSFNFIHSFKTWIYNNKYLFLACYILKLHILHCLEIFLFWRIWKIQQWAVPPTKTIMCKSEILCCCSCNFITTSKVIAIFRWKTCAFSCCLTLILSWVKLKQSLL